jgi:hypothetical protein
VRIKTATGEISVADNGPGIRAETVAATIDYSVRVSSREAYVSPSRGQQGNAMKTLIAMPFALDGGRGETIADTCGPEHRIIFAADQVRQEPKIEHLTAPSQIVGRLLDGSVMSRSTERVTNATSRRGCFFRVLHLPAAAHLPAMRWSRSRRLAHSCRTSRSSRRAGSSLTGYQLGIDDASIPAPEAQIEATAAAPVFTTADDFTASLKLIAEKKYEDVEAEEDEGV